MKHIRKISQRPKRATDTLVSIWIEFISEILVAAIPLIEAKTTTTTTTTTS